MNWHHQRTYLPTARLPKLQPSLAQSSTTRRCSIIQVHAAQYSSTFRLKHFGNSTSRTSAHVRVGLDHAEAWSVLLYLMLFIISPGHANLTVVLFSCYHAHPRTRTTNVAGAHSWPDNSLAEVKQTGGLADEDMALF